MDIPDYSLKIQFSPSYKWLSVGITIPDHGVQVEVLADLSLTNKIIQIHQTKGESKATSCWSQKSDVCWTLPDWQPKNKEWDPKVCHVWVRNHPSLGLKHETKISYARWKILQTIGQNRPRASPKRGQMVPDSALLWKKRCSLSETVVDVWQALVKVPCNSFRILSGAFTTICVCIYTYIYSFNMT